jgi:hypothetical protein
MPLCAIVFQLAYVVDVCDRLQLLSLVLDNFTVLECISRTCKELYCRSLQLQLSPKSILIASNSYASLTVRKQQYGW